MRLHVQPRPRKHANTYVHSRVYIHIELIRSPEASDCLPRSVHPMYASHVLHDLLSPTIHLFCKKISKKYEKKNPKKQTKTNKQTTTKKKLNKKQKTKQTKTKQNKTK